MKHYTVICLVLVSISHIYVKRQSIREYNGAETGWIVIYIGMTIDLGGVHWK